MKIKNLIYDSIIRSYKKSPQFVCIEEKRYFEAQRAFLDKIFADPDTEYDYILKGNAEILSYILFNKKRNILHYVYTLAEHRHKGYAKQLINKNFPIHDHPIITSHYTKTCKYFFEKIQREFRYTASIRYE